MKGSLVAALQAELSAIGPEAAALLDPADDTLELTLANACSCARTAFPAISVEEDAFIRHLARVLTDRPITSGAIAALALEDLYLAFACSVGADGAVATLRARHGGSIRSAIARIVAPADVAESEQRLLESLLVRSEGAAPKIGSYGGKAPLNRWLGVSAHRTALMSLREGRAEARARRAAASQLGASAQTPPETTYMKEWYRGDFEQALSEALARLPERDRVLLRLQLINEVSVEKIGAMYAVSQATASRWLAAARKRLLDDVKQALAVRLGTSSGELAVLAAMVASGLDLSLSVLLKTG